MALARYHLVDACDQGEVSFIRTHYSRILSMVRAELGSVKNTFALNLCNPYDQ